jgi:uncharacterized protein (TIGR00251 family)
MPPDWCRVASDGVLSLVVHVQPGARATSVVGPHGDALKIRLAAPPVDGKANACLLEFVAQWLQVPRASVELAAGTGSRRKLLRVAGVSPEALARIRAAAGLSS